MPLYFDRPTSNADLTFRSTINSIFKDSEVATTFLFTILQFDRYGRKWCNQYDYITLKIS